MASSPLPRHRGTWSTIFVILIFALGVCIAVFGIFNLAMNALLGVSALALGIGLIIPGVWWLRWYQKPQMLRGLIPLSLVLLIPGTVGTALSAGTGNPTSETEPTVASSSPSSSNGPVPSSVVPETSSAPSSTAAPTTSTAPEEPPTTVIEAPETVTVTLTPEPVEPAPITITQILPSPVNPAPVVSPEPVDPVEVPDPEVPPVDDPESPGGGDPVPEAEPAPAPTPAPAPANPWQGLVDQFVR